MPMDRGTPDLVRHCVAAVAKQYGGDTSKAFAICVAQLQKNGYLKPGTMELTAAGKKKEKEHEAEPDAEKKLKAYEKLLKANRKEETTDFTHDFTSLLNPKTQTGLEGIPTTVARKYETVTRQESSMDLMRRLAGITSRHSDRTQLAEGSKQDREVEELVGKKIRAAVAGLQHEITAMQERLLDYNAAWEDRDFKFFVDAGVISKQLFADFEKAQSKY